LEVSRITPSALDRFRESLDHKILYLNQLSGNEPLSIVPLLSEGNLKLLTAEKTSEGKVIEAVIHETEGMPSLLTTCTNPSYSPEFLRRTIQLTLDESPEQTRRIVEAHARLVSSVSRPSIKRFLFCQQIIAKLRDARPDCLIDEIYIPFAESLASKIPDNISARSQWPKFLKMIQVIALAKSLCYRGYYSAKVEGDGVKEMPHNFVVAEPEDFHDAYFCVGSSFFEPLPSTAQRILGYLQGEKEVDSFGKEQFKKKTVRQIMHELKLSKSTIHKYSDLLADLGLISKEFDQISGRETSFYQYIRSNLEIDFEVSDFDVSKWVTENFPNATQIDIEDPLQWPLEEA
jgi:hypothetical protein